MGEKKEVFPGSSRRSMYYVKPEACILVTDPACPVYDARALAPPSEGLVRSVLAFGVKEPILVTKKYGDGLNPVVIAGRKRVLAAREANKRIVKSGGGEDELITIPCKLEDGDDGDFVEILISENEHREEDSVLGKARKAVRLLSIKGDPKIVCRACGITAQTLAGWTKLLELDQKVLTAVEKGQLSASAAVALHGLSAEDQKKGLSELLSSGIPMPGSSSSEARGDSKGDGKRPSAEKAKKVAKSKGKKEGRSWRSRGEINEEIERLSSARVTSELSKAKLAALLWVRGED